MRSLFSQVCFYLPVPYRAAAFTLVALFWSGLTFGGEIHNATRKGDISKVATLLKGDPELVFSTDEDGRTPLYEAADMGHKDVAELLLANKADVRAKNHNGYTSLHWAAYFGH